MEGYTERSVVWMSLAATPLAFNASMSAVASTLLRVIAACALASWVSTPIVTVAVSGVPSTLRWPETEMVGPFESVSLRTVDACLVPLPLPPHAAIPITAAAITPAVAIFGNFIARPFRLVLPGCDDAGRALVPG